MMPVRRLLPVLALLGALLAVPAGAGAATGSTAHDPARPSGARSPHVYNGSPLTSSAQAPWSVLLQRAGNGRFQTYCSANILTPTLVVTAAHCATDDSGNGPVPAPPAQFRVQAGGVAENQPGTQVIGVAGIAVHPYYKGFRTGSDVAVMGLSAPLAFNAGVAPIALPRSGSYVKAGRPLSFFGWGVTETGSPAGLRSMTTTARSSALCAPGLPTIQCAFNPASAPCGGDSGGGLIRTTAAGNEIVAVDSFGAEQCGTGQADGFADLTQPSLNRFVRAVMAGRPSKPPRAPRARRQPTVERVSAFSTRLRCSSARWTASPKVRTYFAYEAGRKVIQIGRGTTFTVRRKHRGKFIYCGQVATNKGGRATVESRNARKFY